MKKIILPRSILVHFLISTSTNNQNYWIALKCTLENYRKETLKNSKLFSFGCSHKFDIFIAVFLESSIIILLSFLSSPVFFEDALAQRGQRDTHEVERRPRQVAGGESALLILVGATRPSDAARALLGREVVEASVEEGALAWLGLGWVVRVRVEVRVSGQGEG